MSTFNFDVRCVFFWRNVFDPLHTTWASRDATLNVNVLA